MCSATIQTERFLDHGGSCTVYNQACRIVEGIFEL